MILSSSDKGISYYNKFTFLAKSVSNLHRKSLSYSSSAAEQHACNSYLGLA